MEDRVTVTEYTVVQIEDKYTKFVEAVNSRIREGWQPFGGVSVSISYDAAGDQMWTSYAQALVK